MLSSFPLVIQSLIAGVILGFSISAPPGPINAMIANQIANKRSWWSGFSIGLGAMTADGFFLVLTYVGWTALIVRISGFTTWIYLIGGLVLLVYASLILRGLQSNKRQPKNEVQTVSNSLKPARNRVVSFVAGLSIGLTNPYQIGWWLTVGLAAMSSFGAIVAIGFFLGILVENFIYTRALSLGFAKTRKLEQLILYTTSAVLVAFGVWFLLVSVNALVKV